MRTWVDASTLIAIDLAGEVEVLRTLLGRVSVTKEVAAEGLTGRESRGLREAAGPWIEGGGGGGGRRPPMDAPRPRAWRGLPLPPPRRGPARPRRNSRPHRGGGGRAGLRRPSRAPARRCPKGTPDPRPGPRGPPKGR